MAYSSPSVLSTSSHRSEVAFGPSGACSMIASRVYYYEYCCFDYAHEDDSSSSSPYHCY